MTTEERIRLMRMKAKLEASTVANEARWGDGSSERLSNIYDKLDREILWLPQDELYFNAKQGRGVTMNNTFSTEMILGITKDFSLAERLRLALLILGVQYSNTDTYGEQVIYTGMKYDEDVNNLVKIEKAK